jgi:hypothetical protein
MFAPSLVYSPEILLDGEPSGIVELPPDWVRDDGAYLWTERFGGLRPYTLPTRVFDIFRRELDAAFEDGGLFQLIMHPHVIGYRSRFGSLRRLSSTPGHVGPYGWHARRNYRLGDAARSDLWKRERQCAIASISNPALSTQNSIVVG